MQLVSPAPLAIVFAHAVQRDWRMQPADYRNLIQAAMAGEVHAAVLQQSSESVRVQVVVPAIGGVLRPHADKPGVAWLSIVPGLSKMQVLRASLLMRRVLRTEAERGQLACIVRDEQAAGARLAELLGFAAPRQYGPFVLMSYEA